MPLLLYLQLLVLFRNLFNYKIMSISHLKSPVVSIFIQFLFVLNLFAQNDGNTSVYIDLTKATGDHKLMIEVRPPAIESATIKYFMPKIVPGTYAINNFGRFISDFKAIGKDGSELSVNRIDTSTWEITNAKNLEKLVYTVEDTYNSASFPVVFEPSGTCIEAGKVFMLNNFTMIGYFDGFKDMPFELNITKPAGFYGATSMPLLTSTENTDTYNPVNYFQLHDNPIMYSIPDTASVMVNQTKVLLSIYSPNKKVNAQYMIDKARTLFEAQGRYLGGELPTEKYTVLIYLSDKGFQSGAAGALEHFSSTTFCSPETSNEDFVQPFKDVVSHEFFHLVTPLGIHSYEIGNFDFVNPKMSKHLWLYEGSTEYYAQHSQVKTGLMPVDEFINKMHFKIFLSKLIYNDSLSFTELSKGALKEYKSQYGNVYQKGALISMCLDLYLLHLSDGKYGLQNLKADLGKKFGPQKAFNDDELFDVITEMTYPEVRGFISKYIESGSRSPYEEFLGYAGYDYFESAKMMVPVMFGADLKFDSAGVFIVKEVGEFGKRLKLKSGDRLKSINGMELTINSFMPISYLFESTVKDGDEVTVVVLRKGGDGSIKEKTLKANTFLVEKEEKYAILKKKSPTESQLKIRKAWLSM